LNGDVNKLTAKFISGVWSSLLQSIAFKAPAKLLVVGIVVGYSVSFCYYFVLCFGVLYAFIYKTCYC
jgi:hypothetical protein